MRKSRREPKKKQWRSFLSKVKFLATALYWTAKHTGYRFPFTGPIIA